MNCASKYVYIDENEGYEEIEVDDNMEVQNLWDSSPLQQQEQQQQQSQEQNPSPISNQNYSQPTFSQPPPSFFQPQQSIPNASNVPQPQQQQQPFNPFAVPPPPSSKKKIRFRQATTNVVSIDFGKLSEDVSISTGDAIVCKSCRAVFSYISKLEKKENEQIWNCEFCGTSHSIQIEEGEIPRSESVDYIISPPTSSVSSTEASSVIFCVDISGSMGVSYEVEGTVSLKGKEKVDRLQNLAERNASGQVADQLLPNERRGVTYITRLQCVQAAIVNQIEAMANTYPNKRVSVITFNNEVTLLGDGAQIPSIITGDKLYDYQALFQSGEGYAMNKPIKEAKDSLVNKLFSLEEGGSTALGPALVCALGMSSKKPGSTIILCTDGLSNVGLGSLDELYTDEEKESASKFYEQIGQVAQAEGIAISVISIKGSDCSIETLGHLSELSGGSVDRVDPLDITKNFQSILSLPVIATHVTLDIHLHKGLFIRSDDDLEEPSKDQFYQVRQIGNVTKETITTVDYGIRPESKQEFSKLKELPFQIQITYTRTSDGMKCMRVISKTQPITFDKVQAEENADLGVLGTHGIQTSAKMAQRGEYEKARFFNLTQKDMLARNAKTEKQQVQFSNWSKKGALMEEELSNVQKEEKRRGFKYVNEDNKEKKAEKEEKMKSRKHARSDETSNMIYKFKYAHFE